jgi:uncharacterized glyoxalase superfamily protein PhnB/uncharacterized protein YndB with AHSA1/START domain
MSLSLTASRRMPLPPTTLYRAWAGGFSYWFAEPGTQRGTVAVGEPFFFEVVPRDAQGTVMGRHPHYGRYLALEPERRVQITWFTRGTGVETTITVELTPDGDGTHVALTHEGFATEESRDNHANAWTHVLAAQEQKLLALGAAGIPATALAPNRSIPQATFIPVRSYPDLTVPRQFLCDVLGAREQLRVGEQGAQFVLGNGAMAAWQWTPEANPAGGRPPATLTVRVTDVHAAVARAVAMGASLITPPTDHAFGERQAVLKDPAGHSWTLSQTIADVDPQSWGGELR